MRKLTLAAVLSSLAFPLAADDAAVLIGVDRYDDFRRVSDATDILDAADALRDAGYDVQSLSNGDAADMRRVLGRFAQAGQSADRLVVALSGRFVTDENRTWFLAKNADAPAPFGLDDAVSVDTVMQVLARAPGQAVLVLGYDQDGFSSFGSYLREGVGRLDVPQGVTVIYGEPDRVDDVLSGAVAMAGADVIAYVRGDRRLNMLGYQPQQLVMQPETATSAPPPVAPRPQVDPALRAWNSARAANTADAYRDFIFTYPRSAYAEEARTRLDAIENDPVRLAERAEAGLNLDRAARRTIQGNLTVLGFDTRGVDGIFGRGSRTAIANWQRDNGFVGTGFLDAVQINRIDAQAGLRRAEIAADEERAREEALRLDREYWAETGATGSDAGYRAYLQRYPQGSFAEQARAALAEVETANTAAANEAALARENALNINATLRRLIESRLAGLGFNPGAIDGRFDADTRRAIAAYQAGRNLTATGYIDQPTLARLLADTFGR